MAEKGETRDPSSHRTPGQIKRMNQTYDARPDKIAGRAQRNAARAALEKKGVVKKGDGKDVDHIKPVRSGGTNAPSNLRVVPKSINRGWRKKT